MTDKELHKLKRAQLLDLMLAQSQEIERLEKKLGEHEQKQNTEDILETETFPALEQLERELKQENYKKNFSQMFRSTLYTLVIVAAVAVLVAVLLLPVLKIYGMSMNPSLTENDIVLSVKGSKFDTGDIIAFYYNNKILVKRVIAQSGDWIDIAKDGTVYVNNVELKEPYLSEKAFGECDIELPYQVPESKVFVMGDHRSTSVDSRSTVVGCVSEEQVVGKIVFRVWPMTGVGFVN